MRRPLLLVCALLFIPLLSACGAAPCERQPSSGYSRHPADDGLALRFDYPSGWEVRGARLEGKDPSGEGLNVLVQFYAAPIEKYPHIFSAGQILTGQEWGSPFPGREVRIAERKLDLGGLPGLTVSFDFEAPLTLMDGTSPVRDWGYMQFTFLPVDPLMYDIRFYASDRGQEEQIRREFVKLVNSICVPSLNGGGDG